MSFFIEFREGEFIDGEKVNWIKLREGRVDFTLDGEEDNFYVCEGKYGSYFINSMQLINQNFNFNLENRYHEINKTGDDDEI